MSVRGHVPDSLAVKLAEMQAAAIESGQNAVVGPEARGILRRDQVDLHSALLPDLQEADPGEADLREADPGEAHLRDADPGEADLPEAGEG